MTDESASEEQTGANPNKAILDEVNAAATWFHAKKTAPLWAKKLTEDQTVETLEGPASAKAGDFLCRGAAGEFWPQSEQRLSEKYDKTDEVDTDGFQKFLPKSQVMAAQVDRAFQVKTSWGDLEGSPGDFLLKAYSDKDVPYPESVWIVGEELFAKTYARIEE